MYPNIFENRKNPAELFENWKVICYCFYTWNYLKSYETLRTIKNPKYVLNGKLYTDRWQQTAVCGLTSKKKSKGL
jgi:hypothetical protein